MKKAIPEFLIKKLVFNCLTRGCLPFFQISSFPLWLFMDHNRIILSARTFLDDLWTLILAKDNFHEFGNCFGHLCVFGPVAWWLELRSREEIIQWKIK